MLEYPPGSRKVRPESDHSLAEQHFGRRIIFIVSVSQRFAKNEVDLIAVHNAHLQAKVFSSVEIHLKLKYYLNYYLKLLEFHSIRKQLPDR